jgi:hypothetical protein
VFGASSAGASNPYLEIPSHGEALSSRAYGYANMSNEQAYAELRARGVPFEPAIPPLPGVRAPIRLRGPLRGVAVHSSLPAEERAVSPFEILDARLALALDDFCALLARHDVVELVHYTMYRPSVDKVNQGASWQTRHPGGLAIDVGGFRKRSGRWLAVGPHWPSRIGARTCGQGARELRNRPARELVSIVCEAADLRLFHYMLTPHFDEHHSDHLHLEIKPGVKWFLVN